MDGNLIKRRAVIELLAERSQPKHRRGTGWRKGLSTGITWLGLGIVGILAVPVGLLLMVIAAVWSLTDRLASRIQRREEPGRSADLLYAWKEPEDCPPDVRCPGA